MGCSNKTFKDVLCVICSKRQVGKKWEKLNTKKNTV